MILRVHFELYRLNINALTRVPLPTCKDNTWAISSNIGYGLKGPICLNFYLQQQFYAGLLIGLEVGVAINNTRGFWVSVIERATSYLKKYFL